MFNMLLKSSLLSMPVLLLLPPFLQCLLLRLDLLLLHPCDRAEGLQLILLSLHHGEDMCSGLLGSGIGMGEACCSGR